MAKSLFDATSIATANLLEQAPVVPGGIVSKALIDLGSLKQILFAMDGGQQISEHKAPFVASVQVLSGRMKFRVGGQEREMGPQDWIIMPSNEAHDLIATEPVVFLLTLVKK